jgi:hypothetical protein
MALIIAPEKTRAACGRSTPVQSDAYVLMGCNSEKYLEQYASEMMKNRCIEKMEKKDGMNG